MALDERDYMRARARRLVERHYYGNAPRRRASKSRPEWLIGAAWIAAGAGLYWLFKAVGY